MHIYKYFIATLGSILDSQLSWESGKFQLARWSHEVVIFPERTTHPDHMDFSCWIYSTMSMKYLGNVWRVSEGCLGNVREVSGRCLIGVWNVSVRFLECLKDVWWVSWGPMTGQVQMVFTIPNVLDLNFSTYFFEVQTLCSILDFQWYFLSQIFRT